MLGQFKSTPRKSFIQRVIVVDADQDQVTLLKQACDQTTACFSAVANRTVPLYGNLCNYRDDPLGGENHT